MNEDSKLGSPLSSGKFGVFWYSFLSSFPVELLYGKLTKNHRRSWPTYLLLSQDPLLRCLLGPFPLIAALCPEALLLK